MRADKLQEYEGQVAVLDLISGREITAQIGEVNPVRGTVICHKPYTFVQIPDQATGGISLMPVKYGEPFHQCGDEIEVDLDHIFTVFKPSNDHVKSYRKKSSGIEIAGESALNNLPDIGEIPGLNL